MNELAALQQRLQTLETRQRRMRSWCVASTALWIVSCLAAVAAPWHEELRVKRLVLVDENGKESGTLGTDEDGASLTLKSRDEKATVQLMASTATWTEQHMPAHFAFSIQDGRITEPEPEETHHEGPWSGLIAWTGEEKKPDVVTSVSASERDGFWIARGERKIDLTTSGPNERASLQMEGEGNSEALLSVGKGTSAFYMEGGEDTSGVLNLYATAEGCWLGGSWNDRYSFDLDTRNGDAWLSLAQLNEDEEFDAPQEVELHAKEDHGTLELRDESGVTFHAPN